MQPQELYDHRNESASELSHRETTNLILHPAYAVISIDLRRQLVEFVKKILFRDRPFGRV